MKKRILHLNIKEPYFSQIKKGEKQLEYREIKEYWTKRLHNREYDEIHIKNGYARNGKPAPFFKCIWNGYATGRISHPVFGSKVGANRVLEVYEIDVSAKI